MKSVNGNAKIKFDRYSNSFDVKLFKKDLDKNLKSNNTVNFFSFLDFNKNLIADTDTELAVTGLETGLLACTG